MVATVTDLEKLQRFAPALGAMRINAAREKSYIGAGRGAWTRYLISEQMFA